MALARPWRLPGSSFMRSEHGTGEHASRARRICSSAETRSARRIRRRRVRRHRASSSASARPGGRPRQRSAPRGSAARQSCGGGRRAARPVDRRRGRPGGGSADFDECKRFARAIAAGLREAEPDLVTNSMSPRRRGDRVLVDDASRAELAAAAARAAAGPFSWEQIGAHTLSLYDGLLAGNGKGTE